jgi:hypothetical protein
MSKFTNILIVSPLPDGKSWVIRNSFSYDIGEENSKNTINIPIGFTTDFTSVPRFLWWLFPRWGKYGNAAVIHDYCYWEQMLSRKEADLIFKEAMEVLQVPKWKISTIYRAVRTFGHIAWNKNKKNKEKGVTKILKKLPQKTTHFTS